MRPITLGTIEKGQWNRLGGFSTPHVNHHGVRAYYHALTIMPYSIECGTEQSAEQDHKPGIKKHHRQTGGV